MPRRLYEIAFIASAVALVALVGAINCLQGTPFVAAMKCNYNYTSADLLVKVIAAIIFLLFLALLLGPVAGTLLQRVKREPSRIKT
jgi:ribose/xylose/arabinose/galactoside ABC-type transport system permease subunit